MKMRLVVIDDEVLVRKGIIKSIDWNKYGIEIVGEAFDGNSGIEVIQNTCPHIVLTDIRMPNMNGLQLIRKVREEFPDTKFLILSVLEEFQTVREALQLGVTDYISKLSMTPEELLKAVLKIKDIVQNETDQQLDGQQKSQEFVQDNRLDQWMFGEESEKYEERMNESEGCVVGRVYFQIENENHIIRKGAPIQLYKRIDNILQSDRKEMFSQTYIFQVTDCCFSLFMLLNQKVQNIDLQSSFQQMVNLLKSSGFIISIGISDVFHDTEYRSIALEQAANALEQKFYYGSGFVHEHMDMKSETPVDFFDKKVLAYYFSTLELDDEALSIKAFHELFPERIEEIYPQKIVREEIYHWISSVSLFVKERGGMLSSALGEESPFDQINKLNTYFEIKNWCLRLNTVVLTMLGSLKNMHRHEIIKAIEYTKNHYMKVIRVKEVADMVYLSENYFSFIFTKETGKTFSQYLYEVRIEKAKELLHLYNYSWIEVGEKVGFENPKYFTKAFKKSMGITPKKYAESRR